MTDQEDVRKQRLATQLFSGVTDKQRPSAGRGHLAANRISRNPGKTRLAATNPGMATSADDLSQSVKGTASTSAGKSNIDLLLDLESTGAPHIGEEKASSDNDALISPSDNTTRLIPPRDTETLNLNSTQESLDSDFPVLMNTSKAGYGNAQKVWHIFLFIKLFSVEIIVTECTNTRRSM